MRGLFLLLFFLLGIWWAVSGYWYVCKIKNKCVGVEQTAQIEEKAPAKTPEPVETPKTPKTTKKIEIKPEPVKAVTKNPVPLSIAGMSFANKSGGNILFNKTGRNAAFPVIQEDLKTDFQSIRTYLQANSSKAIELTGLYTSDDDKHSAFENLGLARAENVKLELLKAGIKSQQIITKAEQINRPIPVFEDKLTGALTAKIIAAPKPKEDKQAVELKEIEDKIKAAPKTVYFETNSSKIIKTPDLNQYVENLKTYLKAYPSKKIQVIGHTDNVGSTFKNRELGLKRAIFVKEYLTEKGINQNQVTANSEGPDNPIASNKTLEGRKRNRRVEISFK